MGTRWWHHAKCAGMNPEWFVIEPGDVIRREVITACHSCPVQRPCLEAAIREEEHIRAVPNLSTAPDIRGGYTAQARSRLANGYPAHPIWSQQARRSNREKLRRLRKKAA